MILDLSKKIVLDKKIFFSFLGIFFLANTYPVFSQESIIITVQRSLPSVVNIIAENATSFKSPDGKAAFDRKSGKFILLRNLKTAYYKRGGAGIILNSDGLIATNAHTVNKSARITVELHDGTQLKGKIVKLINQHDVALLKVIPPNPLVPISFSDSNRVRLNDEVVTIGSSQLLKQTISAGKVIGIGTSQEQKRLGDTATKIIQTNIALYKGDSGGPLLDRKGHFIGLMAAGQIQKANSSFAIPSNQIWQHYLGYLNETNNR